MTPEQKKACSEYGAIPFSQAEREEIAFTGNQLLTRVVAEIIKRLPEKDKIEIISLIEGHRDACDKANAIPQIAKDEELEVLTMAATKSADDLLAIIKSPEPWLCK